VSDFDSKLSSFDRIQPSPFVREVHRILRHHVGEIVAVSAVKTVAGRLAKSPAEIGPADAEVFIDTLIAAMKFMRAKGALEPELRALLKGDH